MRHLYLALFLFIVGSSCAQKSIIPFNSEKLYYEGRILNRSNAAELTWPGTSVSIRFKGKSISAILQDLDTANYYNVIIDNKVISKIHTDSTKKTYLLANNLKKGEHYLQLFKRTEWDKGKTLFFGFEVPKNTKILAPKPLKNRKIEFFGNSITCGYANEDSTGQDRWFGYFQNNYLTYAAITARHFNAQYMCTSKSGIGIMLSWFPLIMPEMYNRLDPTDSLSRWDFTKYTPDVVVINLFQNDSWLVKKPEHEEFKRRFGEKEPEENFIINSYKNFVNTIRQKYPNAHIICALGCMDATREGSLWPSYVTKAVEQLNDSKIYTNFFKFKGAHGHPIVSEQKEMAKSLIWFIEKKINW